MTDQPESRAASRDAQGRWLPGDCPNPGGRPKSAAEIRALALKHAPAAIRRLVELSRSKDGPVAVSACRALLDRAIGRPTDSPIDLPPPSVDGRPIQPPTLADFYRGMKFIVNDPDRYELIQRRLTIARPEDQS